MHEKEGGILGYMSMDVYIYMGYNKGTVKETDRPPAGKDASHDNV